ncbi:inosine/xanthosine triphosphatase [Patescibacteria group bacterium]
MKIVVGSTNPVKINSVKNATKEHLSDVEVIGVEVESSVSDQPMSDEETKNGAFERAVAARNKMKSDYGIGLEGGVFVEDGKVWNTVWCCVVDGNENVEYVNGFRFVLPEKLERKILKGEEMGPAMDSLIGTEDIKKKQGSIWIMTDGWITREECYRDLVRIALGRILSKDW